MNNSYSLLSNFTHDELSAYTHDNMIGVSEHIIITSAVSTITFGSVYFYTRFYIEGIGATVDFGAVSFVTDITFNRYKQELGSPTRYNIFKIEFLRDEDESPFYEVTTHIEKGGTITINNQNGVRRAINIPINNQIKEYFPNPDGKNWLQKKIKVYTGLKIGETDYFIPQGIFILDNPTISSKDNVSSVTLSGIDKFGNLNGSTGGELNTTYEVPSGSDIKAVLTDILVLDIVNDVKGLIYDNYFDGETTFYTIRKEAGNSVSEIVIELAELLSANVYYNNDGYLVFEKDIPDEEKGSVYDFGEENDLNYIDGSLTYKYSEVRNAVKVYGENFDGNTVSAEVENNDLLSPVSIPNIGIKRTLTITDNNIYTIALATLRAEYELKKITRVLTEGSISSINIYDLDIDSIVTLQNEYLGLDEAQRFIVNNISMTLDGTQMTIGISKSFDTSI